MDVSSTKTLLELITSFAAANVYDIIDSELDECDLDNPVTEVPALGVYRSITTSELEQNVEQVTQRIKEFNDDLVELLSGIHTDATMALDDDWDRGDDGFYTQQDVIEKFAAKYGIVLEEVEDSED